jgi:hypothetical protein
LSATAARQQHAACCFHGGLAIAVKQLHAIIMN